jgi:hypothetical protein
MSFAALASQRSADESAVPVQCPTYFKGTCEIRVRFVEVHEANFFGHGVFCLSILQVQH